MTGPSFRIEAKSSGAFPWRWDVVLRQRIPLPAVLEHRTIVRAGGWTWTPEAQERRIQAAMDQCRALAAQLGEPDV